MSLERLRQALYALGALSAAAAAWRMGGTLFVAPTPAGDAAALERPFPPAPPPRAAGREDRTLESFRAVTSRRLVPPAPASGAGLGPPPFKLAGVNGGKAIVVNSRGDTRGYKVGEMVLVDQARVLAVVAPRARFLWQGREVELGPEGPPASPVVIRPGDRAGDGTQSTITAAEWGKYYADTAKLWQQFKVDQHLVNGRQEGVRLAWMHADFPGRRFGLKEGDIVRKVNDTVLDNPVKLGELLGQLREPKDLRVEVERGGKPLTLTVKVGEAAVPK